jgi:hypothetical protein
MARKMTYGLSLSPWERVIWAGMRGQPANLPGGAIGCRMLYGYMVLFCFAGIVGIPLLVIPETRLYAIPAAAVILGLFLLYRRYRKRPSIFLTDKRLVERSLFGTTSVELAAIQTYRRRVDKYQDRYGNTSEVGTNHLQIRLRDGRVSSVGPVLDYDELTGFLDGVLSGDIDPSKMPSLDGKPAMTPREDIFVALESRSGDMTYGPLVIGPRGLVRFTDKLSPALTGLLLTALSRPDPAESVESRVVFLARRPDAGHALIVDLSTATLGMEGAVMRLQVQGRTEHLQLSAEDAMRASKFLKRRA